MTRIPKLFELMNQNGLKAKSLASQLPISEGNISDWKSGRSMPSADKLIILADYFHVSVDYLLGRTTSSSEISGNHISGNNNNGNNSIRVGAVPDGIQDNFIAEFLKRFEKLDFDDKLEIMNLTAQKLKKSA